MAKPKKNYQIELDILDTWFQVYAVEVKRFISDISAIEGVESCTLILGSWLTVCCSPLYDRADIVDEVTELLKATFEPIAESFKDVFDD